MSSRPTDTTVEFETFPVRFGEHADPVAVKRIARAAEANGFTAIQFPDHVALPVDIPPEYPFNESGEYPWDETAPIYDVFGMLSFIAGATTDLRLKSSVCVAPFRHPVLLAKNALSLDALSDGRFEFGVGLGWLRTEFEVLGAPYEERASRTDEFLDLFESVCRKDVLSWSGRHHSFQATGFYPRPVQAGGPPIWIGGYTDAAFRRTAKYGVGWTAPGGISLERVAEVRQQLEAAWSAEGRTDAPQISMALHIHEPDSLDLRPTDDLLADVERFVDAGATRITVYFRAEKIEDQLEHMERIGTDVIDATSA